jgi:hypothetical protein
VGFLYREGHHENPEGGGRALVRPSSFSPDIHKRFAPSFSPRAGTGGKTASRVVSEGEDGHVAPVVVRKIALRHIQNTAQSPAL